MAQKKHLIWLSFVALLSISMMIFPGHTQSIYLSSSIINRVDQTQPIDPASLMTATPVSMPIPTNTPTPFPQEFLDNARMTTGIAIGAALLVLIVVGGTVRVLSRKEE